MYKRAALIALFLSPTLAVMAQGAIVFRDIPEGSWPVIPATILAQHQIMPGRTPVDFAGQASLTRYELAHILSELYGVQSPSSSFIVLEDMQPGAPNTLDVQRALGYGLMAMRKPGYFAGTRPATREEVFTALDTLFSKNGITPPDRALSSTLFIDVKPNTALGQVLDRLVNHYAILTAKNFSKFQPHSALTRYQMLQVLEKAMPYINPSIAAELRHAAEPSPVPSGETPAPSPEAPASPAPAEASAAPLQTPTPVPVASLESGASPGVAATPAPPEPSPTPFVIPANLPHPPILGTRAWADGEVLLAYFEGLPRDTSLVATQDQPSFSGNFLPAFGLGAEYWSDLTGYGLTISATPFGIDIPYNGRTVSESIFDALTQGTVTYKLLGGENWELALGGAGLFRYTYNISGNIVDLTYLAADKLYLGAGGAALLGYRFAPNLNFTGRWLLYPGIYQHYIVNSNQKQLFRWGTDLEGRLEYALTPNLYLYGTAQTYLSAGYSGGFQALLGTGVGVGGKF